MILRKLIRNVKGYVTASCAAESSADILDSALKAHIDVFDVSQQGDCTVFSVSPDDYIELSQKVRKKRRWMKIKSKHGLYLKLIKNRSTLPFAVGVVVFFAVLSILGSTVFTIAVEGPSTMPKAQVIDSLRESGLTVLCRASEVDAALAAQNLMLYNDRLSWASVNIFYGKAVVVIKDKSVGSLPRQNASVASLYDAQIKSIDLISGVVAVKVGDTVTKGQMLVLPNTLLSPDSHYYGAQAAVMGLTNESVVFSVSVNHIFREKTGKTEREDHLIWLGGSLPLTHGAERFDYYDAEEYIVPIKVFSTELPIKLKTLLFQEVAPKRCVLNAQQAQRMLDEYRVEYEENNLADAQIVTCSTELGLSNGVYTLRCDYICLRDIAGYIST